MAGPGAQPPGSAGHASLEPPPTRLYGPAPRAPHPRRQTPPARRPPLRARRRDADRVAGLLEANNIYNVKLLVNRVRPDMIQSNDMMSVKDVQVGCVVVALGVA